MIKRERPQVINGDVFYLYHDVRLFFFLNHSLEVIKYIHEESVLGIYTNLVYIYSYF